MPPPLHLSCHFLFPGAFSVKLFPDTLNLLMSVTPFPGPGHQGLMLLPLPCPAVSAMSVCPSAFFFLCWDSGYL